MDYDYHGFNARLRKALKAAGMTQKRLSEKIGLTEVTVNRYVNGPYLPKGKHLVLICKALDVSCDYLLGLED